MRTRFLPLIAIVALCLAVGVRAEFYTGGIDIESLESSVVIDGSAAVSADYVLANTGAQAEEVILTAIIPDSATGNVTKVGGVAYQGESLSFTPGEQKTVSVSYNIPVLSEDVSSVRFDLDMLFNDLYHPGEIGEYRLQVAMPPNIRNIISSSSEYTRAVEDGGRVVYVWEKSNSYSLPVTVTWSSAQYDITARKTVSGTEGNAFRVTNTISNSGQTPILNITVTDSFFPGLFEPVNPADFEQVYGQGNDIYWTWTKHIESLSPGQTVTFTYDIRPLNPSVEMSLAATQVRVGGKVVSVSNGLTLLNGEKGCGNMICDLEETHDACPADCAEIPEETCNSAYDGFCNPDCSGIDLDCAPPEPEAVNNALIVLVAAIVVAGAILAYFRLFRAKKTK